MRSTAPLLLLALLVAGPPGLAAEPAIARPSFPIAGEIQTTGVVFFVPADAPAGAAAIGTAHTFPLDSLGGVKRGELLLGNSRRLVARTSGYLVPPGRPFNAPGASLSDDYVAYSLDTKPQGVRLLSLAGDPGPPVGARVRILGVPSSLPRDEDDLFGVVRKNEDDRIEVDLDVPYDLRGWGGAPVLADASDSVVGMLQAHFPSGSTSRVIVSPIRKVRDALRRPLDGGRGRPFARYAGTKSGAPAGRAARPGPIQRSPTGRTSTTGGHYAKPDGPLIRQGFEDGTQIHLTVEYPPEGAVVGNSACGTFVAGRAIAQHGQIREFDVMLVIDTSRSTVDPSGADINGNGITGKAYLGRIGSIFNTGSTDPGDSILAAEVAAARQLLHGLDPRSTRVGVVAFSGEQLDAQGGLFVRGPRAPAITLQPLTADYAAVESTLDGVLARSPEGNTHMAAGVDQATIELLGFRGALSEANLRSEKIVLFFTDGQPTLPYGPGFEADNVRAVLRAANRAGRAHIRIHSFAIGPDALDGPVATVEMAQRTDGFFTPVRHPGDLVDVVEEVSFADLERVSLKSLTTGEPAEQFRTTADGSWAGFLKLKPGKNVLEVRARTNEGEEEVRKVAVRMSADADDPPVPPELVVARNRLLEDCLRSLKEVRVSVERDRAEQVRKALLVEIEKERAKARARAAEQSKHLQLDIEKGEPKAP